MSMIDHGGHVLTNPHVQLIFWGAYWTGTPSPTPGSIEDAVSSIVTGSYMTKLNQYRGVGPGNVVGTTTVNTAISSSPANPPNPFSDTDITNLMSNLIYAGRVPSPTDNMMLYCVIMPPNVNNTHSNYIGEHGNYTYYAFPLYWANVHWAWVTNNGTLDDVTNIFSHELVEACTDSELNAWYDANGSEIGDVCEGSLGRENNNILVQAYWSNSDNKCVLPTDKTVKDNKDSKDGKDSKDAKDHKERKEKEKDAKEKDRDNVLSNPALVIQLEPFSQGEPSGHPFIAPDERPPVGEQALKQSERTAP